MRLRVSCALCPQLWCLFMGLNPVIMCPERNLLVTCWDRLGGGRSHYRAASGLGSEISARKINGCKCEHALCYVCTHVSPVRAEMCRQMYKKRACVWSLWFATFFLNHLLQRLIEPTQKHKHSLHRHTGSYSISRPWVWNVGFIRRFHPSTSPTGSPFY